MHPYLDRALSPEQRTEDLLSRMSLEDKAGQLFHSQIGMGPGGTLSDADPAFGLPSTEDFVLRRRMTHFNLLGVVEDGRLVAQWHNRLQELAESTPLGIPITLSTDPRHHFTDNPGAAFNAGAVSQWPEPLGLAALRSAELVQRFADIARQEYLALGFRVALHPQVDLATEPRWSRIGATFGEDADLTSELAVAYVRGFQGSELGETSVSTMTKHFPGGGPQLDGEDPHFAYGREQVYPGNNLEYHLKPFAAVIGAGGSQIMPYYGMPVGTDLEPVAFGFNRGVVTGMLRERLGFDGIVCTDWGLINDAEILGQPMPARAWGVEHLSPLDRVRMVLEAGCDQFGGEACPELVVELVRLGRIDEERVDVSVRRLLLEKFRLGLFDQRRVDADAAAAIVGRADFVEAGLAAQRASYTLLTNTDDILPLDAGLKVYVEGIDAAVLEQHATVVPDPATADVALVRLKAPYEPRPGGFEAHFHAGSLEFPAADVHRLQSLFNTVPTIVDLYLDRPAIVPEIAAGAAALLINYGSSAGAFTDVLFGPASPQGRLPFDLPSSTRAVENSRTDVPFDTADPLFRFGDGKTPGAFTVPPA
jgi:beta-glucosidase